MEPSGENGDRNWVGFAPSGSAYFEASIAWDNDSYEYLENDNKNKLMPDPFGFRLITPSTKPDFRSFNVFGCLYIPGDRIETHLNNVRPRKVRHAHYPLMNVGNQQHFPIILGAGKFPMHVDWVRVWVQHGAKKTAWR